MRLEQPVYKRTPQEGAIRQAPIRQTMCAAVTPQQVFYVIREGKRGTAMPAWKILSPEQTWDLTAYVLGVAEDGP